MSKIKDNHIINWRKKNTCAFQTYFIN